MEFWKGKKVLITGVNGFVGSNLAKRLVEKKANVIGVKRDFIPNSNLIYSKTDKKITKIHGDLRDYETLERAISQYNIDTIFHLAAQAIVTTAKNSPAITISSNILSTLNVLEAAKNIGGVERLIIASSDKAYGVQKELPYSEESPLKGIYPYDVSKTCCDLIGQTYWNTYKLPVGITRFCNIYGEGDLNFSRIIPGSISSFINGEKPIIRSDGKSIREYLYIDDAVEGYLVFAEKLIDKELQGKAINFGSGEKINVLNLIKKIKEIANSDLNPTILGTARAEIDEQYLDYSKAKEVLGWNPRVSLDEGLKKTFNWYKRYLNNNKSIQ